MSFVFDKIDPNYASVKLDRERCRDNLEALKALMPFYYGKVKCIYIDPPYNTGNENWIYNDKVNSPKIKQWLGRVVGRESGIDPAGALERLGAMLKSFENTLHQNPDAITILIASCITDEVEERLKNSVSVKQRYLVTDIINNENSEGDKFKSNLRSILNLT